MKIAICDYSGHPFQVQLSRELARRGHGVLHLFFSGFQTPKGRLEVESQDSPTLAIEGIALGREFEKYSFVKRRRQEQAVGRKIADRVESFGPDVVVGSNLPLDSLDYVLSRARKNRCPFVFWQQDVYSHAIATILKRKFGFLGSLVGRHYRKLEKRELGQSAHVVAISGDFEKILVNDFGIPLARIDVIENWAPLDEITPRDKINPWSAAQGLADRKVVLYTGTLGMKHNPGQILALAKAVGDRRDTVVVVTSEGPAANWLAEQAKASNIASLRVLPFQPFSVYPEVLGSADVLISVLEKDAGVYSVPSKVLSYLCAGRALVLSAPLSNLASATVGRANAGISVDAEDQGSFVNAVIALLDDPTRCKAFGLNGRAYAEKAFDIRAIADRFEGVFSKVT